MKQSQELAITSKILKGLDKQELAIVAKRIVEKRLEGSELPTCLEKESKKCRGCFYRKNYHKKYMQKWRKKQKDKNQLFLTTQERIQGIKI